MSLESALLAAIATLSSVVVTLAGVVVYLWKELRAQYRKQAVDSALYLTSLEELRAKYASTLPGPDRPTPTEPPQRHPQTLEGFYSMRQKTSRTRG